MRLLLLPFDHQTKSNHWCFWTTQKDKLLLLYPLLWNTRDFEIFAPHLIALNNWETAPQVEFSRIWQGCWLLRWNWGIIHTWIVVFSRYHLVFVRRLHAWKGIMFWGKVQGRRNASCCLQRACKPADLHCKEPSKKNHRRSNSFYRKADKKYQRRSACCNCLRVKPMKKTRPWGQPRPLRPTHYSYFLFLSPS